MDKYRMWAQSVGEWWYPIADAKHDKRDSVKAAATRQAIALWAWSEWLEAAIYGM